MSLKLGNDDVTKVMLGSTEVSAVYKGTDEVWSAEEPVVIEPIDDITEVFSVWPYKGTGDGSTKRIINGTNLADGGLVWIKARASTNNHVLFDTERKNTYGPYHTLYSNLSNAAAAASTGVNEFFDDGFDIRGNGSESNGATDYVAWSFQKRPGFMDIVMWKGDGVAGRKIPHNLGVQPGMIIVKNMSLGANWRVYHQSLGATKNLILDEEYAALTQSGMWNDTEPTDKVFTVGDNGGTNSNTADYDYIAYVFADGSLDGSIIKCGSYTGNNSSTQAVDCGFKAGYVLVKSADAVGYWAIVDAERGMPQTSTPTLRANENLKEVTGSEVGIAQDDSGFFVNGGKYNDNGKKYVYMAIKAPPPPPPGPWGTEALSGQRYCYFELQKAGVTFPTDDFTVELWFKSFGGPNQGSYASLFGAWSHPPSNGWMVGYNMNNNDSTQDISVMHRGYSDTYEYKKIATNAMTDWTHFAMTKTGGYIYFWINGVNVKGVSASSYTWGGHTQFYCGGSAIRDAAYGTYSNFRISNIVRYTWQFTPPASPFEPDANTLVLAHQGPEFKDYSGNNVNMEPGGGCKITQDSPWTARDTYSEVANAQNKAAAVKEKVVDKVKDSKDIKDDE